jgi:hypothetical protein
MCESSPCPNIVTGRGTSQRRHLKYVARPTRPARLSRAEAGHELTRTLPRTIPSGRTQPDGMTGSSAGAVWHTVG